jgi:hypothetical protein
MASVLKNETTVEGLTDMMASGAELAELTASRAGAFVPASLTCTERSRQQ